MAREAKEKRGEELEELESSTLKPSLPVQPEVLSLDEAMDPSNATDDNAYEYCGDLHTNHFTVSMRIDASGQMIVDEDSLTIDRAADPEVVQHEESMVQVEETDYSRFVNSATYSRKPKGSRWNNEETILFYNVSN